MNNQYFIYFDIGGVLLDFSGGICDLAKRFDVNIEIMREKFVLHDDDVCRGNMSGDRLLYEYESYFGVKSGIEDFCKYWAEMFTPIKKTHDLVYRLKEENFNIGLLSNIGIGVFDNLKELGCIPDVDYDAIVLSCDEGFVKPEKEIFKEAESRIGFSSKNIVFIDDSFRNVEAAKSFDWKGLLYGDGISYIALNSTLNDFKD